MSQDPLYVASVAETVRSSLRNTEDPAEIRKYLYELKDAFYEGEFEGDLAAELLTNLEAHIDRLEQMAGPVDESRQNQINDDVYRVERFCQRQKSGYATGDESTDDSTFTDGQSITDQNITINIDSADRDESGDSDWPPDGTSAPEPISQTTSTTSSSDFSNDESVSDTHDLSESTDADDFEIITFDFDTEKAIRIVNNHHYHSPYSYNCIGIDPYPNAWELGQFSPALREYVNLITVNDESDNKNSYSVPDKKYNKKLRDWNTFRNIRYGDGNRKDGSQFAASFLQSLNVPWVVKKEKEIGPDVHGWEKYITYLGIDESDLSTFKSGLEQCYKDFQSTHVCHDCLDYVDFAFRRDGYGYLPFADTWNVIIPGVYSIVGRPGAADSGPIRYEPIEEIASWKSY